MPNEARAMDDAALAIDLPTLANEARTAGPRCAIVRPTCDNTSRSNVHEDFDAEKTAPRTCRSDELIPWPAKRPMEGPAGREAERPALPVVVAVTDGIR